MLTHYWKGILATIGTVASLGTCIGTDAPEWLAAIVGGAGVLLVIFGPKNAETPTESKRVL